MLTAHCRRAAGLSFLQINEPTYYFPNCPLAQLTLWGTSGPGMNTVATISSSSLVQAYVVLVPAACFLIVFVCYLDINPSWNGGRLTAEPGKKGTRLTHICSECLYWAKDCSRTRQFAFKACFQAVFPERLSDTISKSDLSYFLCCVYDLWRGFFMYCSGFFLFCARRGVLYHE